MRTAYTPTPEQIEKTQELMARAMILNAKMAGKGQTCNIEYAGHIAGVEFRVTDEHHKTLTAVYAYLDWKSDTNNLEALEAVIAEEEAKFNDAV